MKSIKWHLFILGAMCASGSGVVLHYAEKIWRRPGPWNGDLGAFVILACSTPLLFFLGAWLLKKSAR